MAEKPVTNLIKGVGSLLDRAGAHLVKMFNYLKFCIAEDKKDIEMTITDGIQRKKYANLINYINIVDNKNQAFSLFLDKDKKFITDYYVPQGNNKLKSKECLEYNNEEYIYILVTYSNNILARDEFLKTSGDYAELDNLTFTA